MTVVLGLDLGLKQGWACYDTESGVLGFGRNDWSKLPVPDRVTAFGAWLEKGLRQSGVTVVGFESVTFSGHGRGSEFITRQEGVLQWLCRDVAWVGVNVSTLKKFATGDGHAKKPTMVAAARYGIRALGHPVPEKLSEDAADAFLVLAWVLVNSLKGWKL